MPSMSDPKHLPPRNRSGFCTGQLSDVIPRIIDLSGHDSQALPACYSLPPKRMQMPRRYIRLNLVQQQGTRNGPVSMTATMTPSPRVWFHVQAEPSKCHWSSRSCIQFRILLGIWASCETLMCLLCLLTTISLPDLMQRRQSRNMICTLKVQTCCKLRVRKRRCSGVVAGWMNISAICESASTV